MEIYMFWAGLSVGFLVIIGIYFSVCAGATIADIADDKLDIINERKGSERFEVVKFRIKTHKILVVAYLLVSVGFIAASIVTSVYNFR